MRVAASRPEEIDVGGHHAGLREIDVLAPNDRSTFLSTLPATRSDRRAALAIVGISAILFALAVPFAGLPLAQVPAFVASYQSALAVSDIITAVLLLSQFAVLRSRALLLLSIGYMFTAGAAVTHALTFPGLFAPAGLFGAGPQTTVWLYMIWHAGFPLFVLAYAWLKDGNGGNRVAGATAPAIALSVAGVFVALTVFAWLVTAQHGLLPVLLKDGHYTPTMIGVVSFVWSLSFAALVTLWFRKPHTVIDVWLMVTMCAWLFDIALSAIVNVARFDLGFYAGRLYGLFASSFVLAVLLIENVRLQANTAGMVGALQRQSSSERNYYAERERLFSAVVESSNDAIITKSLDGTITSWNKAAEHVFGYSASEAIGRQVDIIMPEGQREEVAEHAGPHPQRRGHRPARDRAAAQEWPADRRPAEPGPAAIDRRQDHRRLQGRSRHHRAEAGGIRPQPRDRGAPAHLRDLAGPDPRDGRLRQFHPDQPEREGHPRVQAGGHDRAQRHRVHSPR
ncbi:PAS domain-containing protein [Bradyrhizobium sp. S3.14.4]